MSTQTSFKIGERVRVVRPTAHLKAGQIVTIEGFACIDGVAYADVSDGTGANWDLNRFEKVEPEFVVGQQIYHGDYDRLPIGSRAGTIEKTGEHEWRDLTGRPLFNDPHATRTLTHLGDGTHSEPEDAGDIEPEPLKDGDWCLVWGQVDKVESPAGSFVSIGRSGKRRYFASDAIVRPAGQVPPWVKPARCTSLLLAKDGRLARCFITQHDDHEFHNDGRPDGATWTTEHESGRLVENGSAS